MTVNERLFDADLMADYDAAVASNDLTAINKVLEKVGLRRDESGMNLPIDTARATDRKTLQLRDPSDTAEAPTLKKKGRGWEISEKRLDALHERAREMRRFSSEANTALAKRFAEADMGRYTFKRYAVVGSAIVDFNCHTLGMAIMIDEEGQDETLAKRRDKSLEAVGIRVMRLAARDILENMDAVLKQITLGMRMRIDDKRTARREHHRSSVPQNRQRQVPSPTPSSAPEGSGTPDQDRSDDEISSENT